ncbi:hypothetical protein CPB86DRAFT_814986 [Serendipita vermifera]|nr:hypothetical protein CPB86DRAFT_814986 [Serendipita vermifera]
MKSLSLILVTALLGLNEVKAAVPQWGQCGGINYTGETKCVAGCVCVYLNDWYYQCLAAAPTSPSTTTTKKSSTSTKPTGTTKSTSTKTTSTKTTSTKTTSTKTTSTKTTSTKTTSTKTSTTKTSTRSTSTSTSSVTRTTLTSSSSVTRSAVSSTSSATRTCATATSTPTSTLIPLNDLAVAAGKQYFGVAVGFNQYSNATYKVNLDNTHLFGQVTPENEMKWDATEPTQGVFSYTNADTIVDWALCGGKEVRGHTLVWHSQLPSWITSGSFDNSTLVSIMQNHITNLVTHFAGRVKTWDVVNEIFNEDGTWRTSVFYNTIGEYFVDIAFRAAEAADPNIGLAANEYNLDYGGAKATAYINLVNNLKSRGVKITQIGSQSHLIVGSVPSASSLTSTFTAITATGVDLAVTELDIRMTLPVTDALLQQQKKDYNAVVLACMRTTRCVGVTIWTYSDYYSWIPSVFSGQGAALPWDDQLQTKPAFFGIADALQGVDDSVVTTTSTTSTPTSSTSSSSTSSTATPTSTILPLNDLAVAAGKEYFGTAVAIGEYLNATYKVNLDNIHLFGQITPGNEMKWDATEGTRGVFSYTNADTIVSWALGNGKQVRGHTLVWHSQLPSWVTSGGFDNSTLVSILQNHVTNVVTHFAGKVKTWDVVNEIFNEDGTYRSTVFYNTIGEYFVDIAFRAAEAADPTVGLAANEYNLDYGGAKAAAYVTLVNNLKSRGVKITQVGSQSHLIVGSVPSASSLAATFASITATGVELAVTELDIRMTLPVTNALLLQQRKDYNKVILACIRTPGCIGMTIWAYSDYYSWIPSVFSGQGAALPFDDQLQPKPAFYGIADGLQNIDDSGLTGTTSTTTTSTTSTTSTSATSTTTVPASTPSPLNDIAVAAGKEYFGTAVAYGEYLNATYKVNLDNIHLFGQMTPGNEMKWDATEGTRGVFTYTNADTMVAWALGNGKQIRGHTLVWHSQLPSWVSSGNFDNSTLVSILQNHVTNLVTHFSGKVKTWDVVNEIFNEDGTFRTSVFYTTIGEYYVDIAFRAAEAADPNVGLAANEYNLDYGGAKPAAYITLVNNLKSRGVKITQIGSQSHLIVGSVPSASSLTSTFTSITATGVDLAVTELDIRMTLPVTDALLAQQKKDYNKVILACMNTPRCIGMTIWGYSDYYSWIPSVFSGQGAALPWDEQLQPKPAFYGIVDGLQNITST